MRQVKKTDSIPIGSISIVLCLCCVLFSVQLLFTTRCVWKLGEDFEEFGDSTNSKECRLNCGLTVDSIHETLDSVLFDKRVRSGLTNVLHNCLQTLIV